MFVTNHSNILALWRSKFTLCWPPCPPSTIRTFYLSDHFLKRSENGQCRRLSVTVRVTRAEKKSALLGFHRVSDHHTNVSEWGGLSFSINWEVERALHHNMQNQFCSCIRMEILQWQASHRGYIFLALI